MTWLHEHRYYFFSSNLVIERVTLTVDNDIWFECGENVFDRFTNSFLDIDEYFQVIKRMIRRSLDYIGFYKHHH